MDRLGELIIRLWSDFFRVAPVPAIMVAGFLLWHFLLKGILMKDHPAVNEGSEKVIDPDVEQNKIQDDIEETGNEEHIEIANPKNDVTVLCFWAPWCDPCHPIVQSIDELVKAIPQTKFVKINTDDNGEVVARHKVDNIPTIVYLLNGKEMERSIGIIPKGTIEQIVCSLLCYHELSG